MRAVYSRNFLEGTSKCHSSRVELHQPKTQDLHQYGRGEASALSPTVAPLATYSSIQPYSSPLKRDPETYRPPTAYPTYRDIPLFHQKTPIAQPTYPANSTPNQRPQDSQTDS